jgi:hypothetical protein
MRKNPNKYEIREIRGKFVRVFCAVPEIRGIPRILSGSRSVVGEQNEAVRQAASRCKFLHMRACTQLKGKNDAKKYRKSNSAVISFTRCVWNSVKERYVKAISFAGNHVTARYVQQCSTSRRVRFNVSSHQCF